MEHLFDYRHVIEKKTRNILFRCLKKALSEIRVKNIGFVGIIEPKVKQFSHDIDVIIFPAQGSKLGEVILEVGNLYKKTEEILKKHHERFYLALCPKKNMQEMVYYLSTLEEGAAGMIPVHSLFFPDYPSFKKFNPKNFEKSIKNNLVTLYGDFNVIKKMDILPQSKLEPYFVILDFEMNARTRVFPRHLIRTSAESLFNYLNAKYSLNLKKKKLHSISDIEKEFKEILKYLDKITYN